VLDSVTVRVSGKVNLALSVGPLREDGYHDVATVFQAVSLYDDLTVTAAPPGSGIRLTVTGEGVGAVPTDSTNLAVRAVEMMAQHGGISDAILSLNKGIPVAGGMAGGSADAAGALLAIDTLCELNLGREYLAEIGAQLGSDVPFCLYGGTALGTDRGNVITPALVRGDYYWVLALADEGLSTPDVFRRVDYIRELAGVVGDEPKVPDALMSALLAGDAQLVGKALSNDLQRAATHLRPSLAQLLEAGHDAGALGAIVSGSGPTCAFLARDNMQALDIAVALTSTGLCRTVKRATGPAFGATVIDARSIA
jgi:4-diphosphocytidyl-2-C-methyl-D-erythritol kinase